MVLNKKSEPKVKSLMPVSSNPMDCEYIKFKYFGKSLYLSVFLLLAIQCYGQQFTDYKVNANIVYRFTKYVEWPPNKQTGDFIIGIVGDSPIYDELKSLTLNKSVGNQNILIKQFSANASIYNCNMLFISEEESGSLKRIVLLTNDKPILLITENTGLAKKGSCINFALVADRLKLEINKNNVISRNLNIASELLKLATIVN
jgi:hypothetical protein